MRLLSPAKLNLGLWILGKRSDGYHEIITVYHTVDLFDEITIKEGPLRVETSTGIPQEENLVYKALRLMEELLGEEIKFSVYIQKNIPVGAGLGGGSSNVANVLKAVNELLGKPLSFEELSSLAGCVSSDAPFFLYGGTAIGRGKGEIIQPVDHLDLEFTLFYPNFSVSTREVYSKVSERELTKGLDVDKILDCIGKGEFEALENKLGEISARTFPQVGEVVRYLEFMGYRPMVSGSGSCVYVIGRTSEEVKRGASLRGWLVFEVKSWHGV